jgi:predicted aldo/keto reductase-like oxidoreductase
MNFIDTAQAYCNGQSEVTTENLLGDILRDEVVVQIKYYVVEDFQDVAHPIDVPLLNLKDSLELMKIEIVDIYLAHGHIHFQSIAQISKGMVA